MANVLKPCKAVATPKKGLRVINPEWIKKIRSECDLPKNFEPNTVCAALRFHSDRNVRQRIFHALPHGQTDRWEASKGSRADLVALLTELGLPDEVVKSEADFYFGEE